MTQKSVAEENGMPLEARRDRAVELLQTWDLYHLLPEEYRTKKTQCRGKIYAMLSDPLQIGLEALLMNTFESDAVRELVSAMYGEDAALFALLVITTEKQATITATIRSAAAQLAVRTTSEGSY